MGLVPDAKESVRQIAESDEGASWDSSPNPRRNICPQYVRVAVSLI